MGLLVNGQWKDQWYDTKSSGGKFQRDEAKFRNWITEDGNPGPTGSGGYLPESQRYHLYVSLACPWAHRTLIFRKLKDLENHISISITHPEMLEHGWEYRQQDGATIDHLFGFDYHYQIYQKANPEISGRSTVPVLWDKKTNTIVSNESSEIIRMFNSSFDQLTKNTLNFYPERLQAEIDEINDFIYHTINNGVYKCGFATTQSAYEEAFDELFSALDKIEQTLSSNRYLVEDTLTEADWRLFTTLIRFDAVYYGHFKTNRQKISEYNNLSKYVSSLYNYPGVKETVNFNHIKRHYYYSHTSINPTQIIPKGPDLNFEFES